MKTRADQAKGAVSGYNKHLGEFHYFAFDGITESLSTIDYAHHEIHAGSHFLYTDSVSLNNEGVQNYLIVTPDTNTYAHMIFVLDGSAITQFQLYEGGDRLGDVLQTTGNSNRNSGKESTVTVYKGITAGTTDGNLIHQYKGGSASSQSRGESGTRNDEEIILRRNTKYLLKITSGTNSNLTNIRLSWYEHTNLT